MARYWFNYDYEEARITRTRDMVCGWCFGDDIHEAERDARRDSTARYPNRPELKTAKINLQHDPEFVEVTV